MNEIKKFIIKNADMEEEMQKEAVGQNFLIKKFLKFIFFF